MLPPEIEAYYDAVPRSTARVQTIGPFSLFINPGLGFPFYARPSLGETHFTRVDVERVLERQRELSIPQTFEWVMETTPDLHAAAEDAGLAVTKLPLMVLRSRPSVLRDAEVEVRLATVDDDLALLHAIARLAFGSPGTAAGPAGLADAMDLVVRDADALEVQQKRLASGRTVTAVAFIDGQPVGVGSHQPVDSVTELVGIAVLPAYRRHGIGTVLTRRLVDAAQGSSMRTIFLSAGDAPTARIYERVGFQPVGTACIAEPRA